MAVNSLYSERDNTVFWVNNVIRKDLCLVLRMEPLMQEMDTEMDVLCRFGIATVDKVMNTLDYKNEHILEYNTSTVFKKLLIFLLFCQIITE